ncbi:MAG TPA: four helix bundle protein [Bacteroidales bacterium]|nr:four helix bundle protein [Bacteroidales bacterium]
MKSGNLVQEKSFAFALKIVQLYKFLIKQNEFVLSKQVLRSGTSIAANVEEALGSHSRKEFHAKMSVVYKEARETLFWLKLLSESKFLTDDQKIVMIRDCEQLVRIAGSIQKTLKATIDKSLIRNP